MPADESDAGGNRLHSLRSNCERRFLEQRRSPLGIRLLGHVSTNAAATNDRRTARSRLIQGQDDALNVSKGRASR
jgi:hypothetical protein